MATTHDIISAAPHAVARLLEAAPAKLMASGGIAVLGWLTTPGAYQAAILMLLADWGTGMVKGYTTEGRLRSNAMVRGAVKSLVYAGLLGCAWLMTHGGPIPDLMGQAIAIYVLTTEAISNLENLDAIARRHDVQLPALSGALRILRVKADELAPEKGSDHAAQP
jgi:hypothetical protein